MEQSCGWAGPTFPSSRRKQSQEAPQTALPEDAGCGSWYPASLSGPCLGDSWAPKEKPRQDCWSDSGAYTEFFLGLGPCGKAVLVCILQPFTAAGLCPRGTVDAGQGPWDFGQ